jgi:hypothetical protein
MFPTICYWFNLLGAGYLYFNIGCKPRFTQFQLIIEGVDTIRFDFLRSCAYDLVLNVQLYLYFI